MLLARNGKTQHRNGNAKKTRAATVAVPDAYSALREKVEARTARVGIIGLGYVGLPLARTFAAGGYPVLGFDVDAAKVAKLRPGRELHRSRHAGHPLRDAQQRVRGD